MSDIILPSSPDSTGEKPVNGSTLSAHQIETIRQALIDSARTLMGIPYLWGAEWTDYSKLPVALNCSEMTKGVYKKNGLKMPDGSHAQCDFTIPTGKPQIGDLGFFGKGGSITQIYHVGMIFDEHAMIECRGHQPESPFETGKVILRPRVAWEAYPHFVGYRCHPKLMT